MAGKTMNEAELGRYIEQKREELGLTKSAAAKAAGVSRGTWHEIEAGRRLNILAGTLDQFDEALGLDRGHLRHKLKPPLEFHDEVVPSRAPNGGSEDPRWEVVKLVMAMSTEDAASWAAMMRDGLGGRTESERMKELVRRELDSLLQQRGADEDATPSGRGRRKPAPRQPATETAARHA